MRNKEDLGLDGKKNRKGQREKKEWEKGNETIERQEKHMCSRDASILINRKDQELDP